MVQVLPFHCSASAAWMSELLTYIPTAMQFADGAGGMEYE
jgi:hypothetical protein